MILDDISIEVQCLAAVILRRNISSTA